MIYYITDEDGQVVYRADGSDVEVKNGHSRSSVKSVDDLPPVDDWDYDYLAR